MLRGLVSDEESDAVESGLVLEVVAIAATAHADDLQAEGENAREGGRGIERGFLRPRGRADSFSEK